MSTFNGIVSEFPDIRIDFFRRNANAPPPLACFLSHVHSDHLAGLESLKSPFVYCSAATREILLQLERYPCRINYAKGILEARRQTFKHLDKILKPLPLEAPTSIELRPGQQIQVTLFDANHCPGAVMFLVEGDGKAILYTGDIRSEPWFVNAIARNPNLVEYTSGLKTLDKIYLDTSFTEDVPFQAKVDGIAELLRKISDYPDDTIFHLQAWTYGYEDVWIALSKALRSKIHVDEYKLCIYNSLKSRNPNSRFHADIHLTPESPALTGHLCGNTPHPGCLTADINVRLHSCEKGNMCEVAQRPTTVSIQPIIAHLSTGDLAEIGVGGGGDDLQRGVELESLDQDTLDTLFKRVLTSSETTADLSDTLREGLDQLVSTGRNIPLDWDLDTLSTHSADEIIAMLIQRLSKSSKSRRPIYEGALPKTIYFPYSRHSSLPELRHFVDIFRPKDVWPCTFSLAEWLKKGITIRSLFGQLCSSKDFEHDKVMQALATAHALNSPHRQHDSQTTTNSDLVPSSPVYESQSPQQQRPNISSPKFVSQLLDTQVSDCQEEIVVTLERPTEEPVAPPEKSLIRHTSETSADLQPEGILQGPNRGIEPTESLPDNSTPRPSGQKRSFSNISQNESEDEEQETAYPLREPPGMSIVEGCSLARRDAYLQMTRNLMENTSWTSLQLISTSNEYTFEEKEL
ncbi:hypothetical protein NW768_001879 [Fusarium equiseti]|uniref:Protein artemis n=1 Tax=Fusarium equiseti TaxID=61235 RepID=A0ABQ8RMB1_FUSEQ|nr:hypothetical protein NW768_001879 [Fusarium equiseti]